MEKTKIEQIEITRLYCDECETEMVYKEPKWNDPKIHYLYICPKCKKVQGVLYSYPQYQI